MKDAHLCDTTSYKLTDIKELVMFLCYDYLSTSYLDRCRSAHRATTSKSNIHRMYDAKIKAFDECSGAMEFEEPRLYRRVRAPRGLAPPRAIKILP